MQKIMRYSVVYRHQNDAGMIHLIMEDGSGQHFNFHSTQEALLLLDILRNEKPVYYDYEHEIIATGFEKVGEEEGGGDEEEEEDKPKKSREKTGKAK